MGCRVCDQQLVKELRSYRKKRFTIICRNGFVMIPTASVGDQVIVDGRLNQQPARPDAPGPASGIPFLNHEKGFSSGLVRCAFCADCVQNDTIAALGGADRRPDVALKGRLSLKHGTSNGDQMIWGSFHFWKIGN
jgi:hypothetical protein